MTTWVGTTHGCFFDKQMRTPGSSSHLTVTNMQRNFRINQRCEWLTIDESETHEIASVDFSRGWTLNELSELVRSVFFVRGPQWD